MLEVHRGDKKNDRILVVVYIAMSVDGRPECWFVSAPSRLA